MMQSVLKSLIASQSAGYRWIKMHLSLLLLWIHMSAGKALRMATPYFLPLACTTSPNVLVNACSESTWVSNFTALFLTTWWSQMSSPALWWVSLSGSSFVNKRCTFTQCCSDLVLSCLFPANKCQSRAALGTTRHWRFIWSQHPRQLCGPYPQHCDQQC